MFNKEMKMMGNVFKLFRCSFFAVVLLISFSSCSKSDSPTSPSSSSGNMAAGHTVSENGVMHKSGLTNPTANCVSCHGSDLKGGSGPSCYSCHGKKW